MSETKWYMFTWADQSITSAGTFVQHTWPTIGADRVNRIGNKIRVSSIRHRFNMTVPSIDSSDTIRITVFWWMESSTEPTFDAIFVAAASTDFTNQQFNPDNMGRKFKVVKDKTFVCDIWGQGMVRLIRMNLYLKKMSSLTFNSGGTGIAVNKKLYYALASNSVAGPHPVIRGTFITRFKDL